MIMLLDFGSYNRFFSSSSVSFSISSIILTPSAVWTKNYLAVHPCKSSLMSGSGSLRPGVSIKVNL